MAVAIQFRVIPLVIEGVTRIAEKCLQRVPDAFNLFEGIVLDSATIQHATVSGARLYIHRACILNIYYEIKKLIHCLQATLD